ncbi:hypothetical protein [uncultured Thiothrix sp.]|uniref:hypothetical protein n=1 Tax=uncultured Thiothrix sp. TaxID=223185 RepID=UPI00262E2BC1|nr:hypothetical protein [uncultured Thiothrix sp.]
MSTQSKVSLDEVNLELKSVEHELTGVEQDLRQFETNQSNATTLLKFLVYPSLVAFIILAGYGFYLIQRLTSDVNRLAETIVQLSASVDTSMLSISSSMTTMSGQMASIVNSTNAMSNTMHAMNNSTQRMSNDVTQMNASTQHMAVSAYNMQHDMWSMNRSIAKPMRLFNSFMPFGGGNANPPISLPAAPLVPYYSSPYYNAGWLYSGQQGMAPTAPQTPTTVAPITQPLLQPAKPQPESHSQINLSVAATLAGLHN